MANFKNDKMYRPLKMQHRFELRPDMMPAEREQQIRAELEKIESMGYGGIVTNVSFDDYLENETYWEEFVHSVRLCKEMGLRVWLYDEKGYPSGGAGGIVVRDHPEYEANGLVCLAYPVKRTQHFVAELPRGHKAVVAAYLVTGEVGDLPRYRDLMPLVEADGSLCFEVDEPGTVYYIVSKPLFEGVHAARNYHQVRRYVDVLNKEAMRYFIEVTYARYKKYAGDLFGNTIEAVFTDEPSVMGPYVMVLNKAKRNIPHLDDPDEKMPLYPHVVWTNGFEKEFTVRKGYDIMPLIPLLFAGDSKLAQQVRYDYNDVAAQLYEEAYFIGIHDFCRENNLKFTGHLLAEENLMTEVLNEYDYFQMLRNMDYTGIDVLTANPQKIYGCVMLPKIAGSVAHHYARPTVMSEVSDFTRPNYDLSTEEAFASFATQYVYGVTQLNSYFAIDKFSPENSRRLFDAVTRMGQFISDAKHKAPLLVYYPARSSWQYMLPSTQIMGARDMSTAFEKMSQALQCTMQSFVENGMDFDLIDRIVLADCTIANAAVCNKAGEQYGSIYIPMCDMECEGILPLLKQCAQAGVQVYVEDSQLNWTKECILLQTEPNVHLVENAGAAIADMQQKDLWDVKLAGENADAIALVHKQTDTEDRYLLVNIQDTVKHCTVVLHREGVPTVKRLLTDTAVDVTYTNKAGETELELELQPFDVLTICLQ